MKLLILGAGGTGGYFGGRLAAAGVNVRFLVREARGAELEQRGLRIKSALGDVTVKVRTVTVAPEPVDIVILTCKAYDLETATAAIAPSVGPETLVLPLLNGVRHLDELDARFGIARVLGGLCHIGVTKAEDGAIQHLSTLPHLAFGIRHDNQMPKAQKLLGTLEHGGFSPVLSNDIMQAMWEKYTFLAAYAGVTTLMRASIGQVATATDGEQLIRQMLSECVAVATFNGHPPSPTAFETMLHTLTDRTSTGTASMLRDLLKDQQTEHEHILGDMLRRAEASRIETPLLRVSLAHLRVCDSRRAKKAGV